VRPNDRGDGTVPSDSQLAEQANVASNLYTVASGEAPDHMHSPKSDHVWERVLWSVHNGRIPSGDPHESLAKTKGMPASSKDDGVAD